MDLSVTIGGKKLPTPVCVASGTFSYGSEFEKLTDFSSIGAIFTKAVTLKPRAGNEIPRIIETPSGLLNSIGLANVGVDRFLSEKIPFLAQLPCAVIPNVAGSTVEEYCAVVERLESCGSIFGYEINISCPNVKHGALAFGTDPGTVESLTAKLRVITDKPLIIKLTPNVTDVAVIASAAEQGGADAVSCINTVIGMVIDIKAKKTVLPAGAGGLSGPAIRPVGVAITYKVQKAVTIPVIGIGGIMNTSDALEYLLAGASAIQIGTANFINPSVSTAIFSGIHKYCEQEHVSCISDLHKLLH
jgi:dihydroorotate dehydrogenase (NAD+) catalytic subunit